MFLSHDRQLTAPDPITSVISYDAVSLSRNAFERADVDLGRNYETRLPEDRNPRTLALAHEMRARAGSDAEYVRAVLDWFRSSGLEYTLEPGVTSVDSVDTTLFDSKRGFCGHFASAYATMMRAAGVPARIVTGYLGGEWNPVGGYFIVRQSEAHAWTEVWLEGQGWTRIDPTAVVAPERLERGVFDLMADSLPATSTFMHNIAWLNRLTQVWDGFNQWWQGNVVEFNLRAQLDFLQPPGYRIAAMGTPGLGVRARHDAVDCLGGHHPAPQCRAPQARSRRARLAARHAQAGARRAGALRPRRAARLREAYRRRATGARRPGGGAGDTLLPVAFWAGTGRRRRR